MNVIRTLLYVTLLAGLIALLLPAVDVTQPAPSATMQTVGGVMIVAGVALALWCAFTFAVIGRGTPLPFDPPRRLVVTGPYRFVRNPMAIGAGLALFGVAALYQSLALLVFAGVFMLVIHTFVILYEEPTLRRTFGADYEAYCANVNRWLPRRPTTG
ncbi:MAG: isoprenylcysteine carboxylmethyltransferase family protein [Acidiferrobacterales bacterium]|nr:isoprenylcysteine carboxylmethyltransferase family protein [Acidiferrobacterales bacterium]